MSQLSLLRYDLKDTEGKIMSAICLAHLPPHEGEKSGEAKKFTDFDEGTLPYFFYLKKT